MVHILQTCFDPSVNVFHTPLLMLSLACIITGQQTLCLYVCVYKNTKVSKMYNSLPSGIELRIFMYLHVWLEYQCTNHGATKYWCISYFFSVCIS